MATITAPTTRKSRPGALSAAVVLTFVSVLGPLPWFFAPGAGEVPGAAIVFGLVAGAVTLLGARGPWNRRRWGAILVFVLTLLNALSAVPGLFEPPSGWILAEIIIFLPIAVAILVLIALPSSRRAVRKA